MQKYHVYGVGNALVDMEYLVDDSFFTNNEIEKGLMTLVDEDRQNKLLRMLSNLKAKRACGGSAANTIIAVSQFGGNSFYSCKVASDETGDFYYHDLISNGVDTNLKNQRKEGTTGKCLVMVTNDAERTMNTYLGITQTFSQEELNDDALSISDYLYIEGYLVTSDSARAAAIKAKKLAEKNNIKTAITLSDPSMVQFFKDGLKEMIGTGVDLLFCNENEAKAWVGSEDLEVVKEQMKKYAKTFAITLGAKGALVYDGNLFYDIPSHNVKAVDSNGAGDMFAGAFLYAITHGHDYIQAGKLATKAASVVVSNFGPRITKEMTLKIKNEILG